MSEFKACPFCGSQPQEPVFNKDLPAIPNHYTIRCTKCNAMQMVESENRADIVTAWNKRV